MELPLAPEKQLPKRFAAGKTDAQIAAHFRWDVDQVSQRRARLLGKLDFSERDHGLSCKTTHIGAQHHQEVTAASQN